MATGCIRKRIGKNGDVSYQITAEGERDPKTGERNRHYKTIKGTKKQAEATLRKMIADLEAGNITTASAMKVGDWMDEWLTNYLPNIEETTRVGYQEKIDNYIIPGLGSIQLKALKTGNIQVWVNELSERGLSPKTIRNAFINLNAALKKAVRLRMIPFNPCEGVELPKLKKYQAQVYDDAGIKLALEVAKDTDMYLFVLLAMAMGPRRGELAGLKWESVDLKNKVIHICISRVNGKKRTIEKAPKTEAGDRKISIGDEVVAALSQARLDYYNDKAELGARFHDLGYVIRQKNGKPYQPDSLTQKWARFVKKNELTRIRVHDMRHTNATALIHAGVDAKVVQQRLGHSDISVTLNTYTHVLPSMDQDAAERIDKVIFDKASNG